MYKKKQIINFQDENEIQVDDFGLIKERVSSRSETNLAPLRRRAYT